MTTQWLKLSQGSIAYEDAGTGPLVVCVPGLGDLRGEYRFLAPQLAQAGFRVVSMDLRGHGESSPNWSGHSVAEVGEDILALVRHLDAGPAFLVGTSMGAGAAVWAAAEAPEQVRGLVLLGPAVHGDVTGGNRMLYSTLFGGPWGAAAWVKYFSTLFPTRKPADFDAYLNKLRANLREPGRMETVTRMILVSKSASEERLERVSVPVLVLMGTRDPDFKEPAREAAWVAEKLRGTYGMIEGAGHYPHVEMPEVTGSIVLPFLQSLVEVEAKAQTAGEAGYVA